MFKHVELMRKVAFRIMSKTFGARKKDTGEAIYDAYPLNRLVELLCFEDADEARTACKHYNITVKEMKISSPSDPSKSGIADVVFWRKTDFKEPKHPEKGFVLPLQPQKMIKTIERKLDGATRLAVCRGEVSGDGAALSTVLSHDTTVAGAAPRAFAETTPEQKAQQEREEAETKAKAAALQMKQKMERARLDAEARTQREEEHRLVQETERKEAAQRKLEQERLEVEKRRQEIEASREAELGRKQKEEEERKTEIELQRQQGIEEEGRRQKEREAKAAEEEKRRKEAEEKRIHVEEEAARKKVEEAESRRKEEEERHLRELERKHKAEQERMHREAESRRLEEARRQEEERRRREAEERRIENEWCGRIEASRKLLVWRCWRQRVSRRLSTTQAAMTCLQHIDPTFSGKASPFRGLIHKALTHADSIEGEILPDRFDARRILERLLQSKAVSMDLANIALEEVKSSSVIQQPMRNGGALANDKFTLLLKVAVVLPRATEVHEESICELVGAWIDSRLQFDKVNVKGAYDTKGPHYEVRVVTTHGSNNDRCSDCDIALIIVPPPWCKIEQESGGLDSAASWIDDEVPRVVLVLGEEFGVSYFNSMNRLIGAQCGGGMGKLSIIYPSSLTTEAFEKALSSACKTLVKIFVEESRVHVDRIPMMQLGAIAICNALWKDPKVENCYDGKVVLECASSALLNAISEVEKFRDENEDVWSKWPPRDFASGDVVKDYFSKKGDLPVNWGELLNRKVVDVCLAELLDSLKGSFREVIDRLLSRASQNIREECEAMIGRRQFRKCLERALLWRQRFGVSSHRGDYLYLPSGMLPLIIERATKTFVEDRNSVGFTSAPTEADTHIIEIESGVNSHANRAGSAGVMSKSARTKANQASTSAALLGYISPRKVDTTSTIGNKSNKRSLNDMESPDFLRRGNLSESTGLEKSDKKRRDDGLSVLSIEQKESAAFTKKLEELLHGETIDLAVGETTLSAFLRSVPKIDF
jgi:hypothetical protein